MHHVEAACKRPASIQRTDGANPLDGGRWALTIQR